MELKQLRHFQAVVESGSFSRAALRLGLTQQAVSKSILALEAGVGVELLDRRGRKLMPTVPGHALVARAATIFSEIHGFEADLPRRTASLQRRVRIGASPTATEPVVTPAVLALLRARPEIHIEVTAGIRRDLLPQLEQGDLDAVVCLDIEETHSAAVSREVLCYDEYAVVAGRRNPLGRRDDVQAADLVGRPWILGRNLGDVAAAWESVWTAAGLAAPTPAIETSSLDFCRSALRESPFLTILPRGLVAADVAARRLQIIPVADFAWERPIALYYRRKVARGSDVAALLDGLRAAAAAWRD